MAARRVPPRAEVVPPAVSRTSGVRGHGCHSSAGIVASRNTGRHKGEGELLAGTDSTQAVHSTFGSRPQEAGRTARPPRLPPAFPTSACAESCSHFSPRARAWRRRSDPTRRARGGPGPAGRLHAFSSAHSRSLVGSERTNRPELDRLPGAPAAIAGFHESRPTRKEKRKRTCLSVRVVIEGSGPGDW